MSEHENKMKGKPLKLKTMNWRHKQYLHKYKKQREMNYRTIKPGKTSLNVNTSYEGETIEQKIHRIVNNNEPIKDGSPRIYTERQEGVLPAYDIRTDRFEVAVEAMDQVDKAHKARREDRIGQKAMKNMTEEEKTEYVKKHPNVQWKPTKKDGGAEPTQGT